jgi:hypothetical protein
MMGSGITRLFGWPRIRDRTGLARQHGAGHRQPPVGNAAQGTAAAMAAFAQFGVAPPAEFVVLDDNAGRSGYDEKPTLNRDTEFLCHSAAGYVIRPQNSAAGRAR